MAGYGCVYTRYMVVIGTEGLVKSCHCVSVCVYVSGGNPRVGLLIGKFGAFSDD